MDTNTDTKSVYTKAIVLNTEDQAAYLEGRDILLEEWDPATQTEQGFVMDIVDARWRLNRLGTIETAALDLEMNGVLPHIENHFEDGCDIETHTALGFQALANRRNMFQAIQSNIRQQHRIIDRAINQLLRLRKIRPVQQPQPVLAQNISEIRRNEPSKAAAPVIELSSRRPTTPNLDGIGEQVGVGNQNNLPFALQSRVPQVDLRNDPVKPGDRDMIAA